VLRHLAGMRILLWLGLAAVVLAAVAFVALPAWLIQPFAAQTPNDLAWSHAIKQAAPRFTAVALVASAIVALALWRAPASGRASARWNRVTARTAIVTLVLVAGGATWFSRQNHFEWMFRPNPEPVFVAVSEAADVDAGEPVIGVTAGTDALAFPITRIGYHHLVNTTIGRTPIVATY
jgi:Protein of unknown function (DUF3179)